MTSGQTGGLATEGLTLGYGKRAVVEGLSLGLIDGQITTIIGPNGCGKSTLLRAMARLLKPREGVVYLDGQAIQRFSTKEVARRLGLLAQHSMLPDGITVEDLVRRGRFPHQGFFQPPTRADRDAVERALELAGVVGLRDRQVDELSGGQRQRAWIALVLAQETRTLLLDEPTTYLDVAHQQEVLELVRRLNREEGRTVVMVLHDINQAAATSDRLVAMRDGMIVADGAPQEVLAPETLYGIFGVMCDVVRHPGDGSPISIPRGAVVEASRQNDERAYELSVDGVALGYGRRKVVDGLSLTFPAGKVSVIVGANACGKSTLLRALGRLLKPRDGFALLDGRHSDRYRPREFAQRVGVLPQSPTPPPDTTVHQLVASGRYPHQRWYRQWSREDEKAVADALEATAMTAFADRPVEALSGGQRQRAFLAMALARKAPVLLLDEPTTFLDIAQQVAVLDLVRRANVEHGTTVVMVIHDLALACRYADNLVAMKDGRLVAAGTPREIVTPELVRTVFGIESCVIDDVVSGAPMVLPNYGHETAGGRLDPAPWRTAAMELQREAVVA